jgi:hypothetical protein
MVKALEEVTSWLKHNNHKIVERLWTTSRVFFI